MRPALLFCASLNVLAPLAYGAAPRKGPAAAPLAAPTPSSSRALLFADLLNQALPPAAFDPYLERQIAIESPSGVATVEACFLLNLDCRKGRLTRCQQKCAEQGISLSRVPAVVGARLPVQALESCGLRWEPWMANPPSLHFAGGDRHGGARPSRGAPYTYYLNSSNMGRGALGCSLSHLSALQSAWEAGLSRIWIFEDDFDFLAPKAEVEKLIRELDTQVGPDGWDLLYTDPDSRASAEPLKRWRCMRAPTRPDFRSAASLNRQQLSPRLERIGARYGTYSMIINRSGIHKLLTFFRHFGLYGPIDWDLHMVPGLRQFASSSYLVSNLIVGSSDVQQEIKQRGPQVEPGDDPEEVWAALGAGAP
jgi:GR25 family glycosyltransferase involved in LPS biosynthesis